MNKPLSIVVAIAAFAGSALVGVAVARALQDDAAPASAGQPMTVVFDAAGRPVGEGDDDTDAVVAELAARPSRLAPVLEPVAVGRDDRIGEALLEQQPLEPGAFRVGGAGSGALPPSYSGATPIFGDAPEVPDGPPTTAHDDTDTPTTGTASSPSTDDRGPGSSTPEPESDSESARALYSFDLWSGWFRPLMFHFDPCAGDRAGTPTPEDCPDGYPAAFGGGTDAPPPPFVFWGRGHHLATDTTGRTCPAGTSPAGSDEAAITMYTRTPLAEVTIRYRPYGTSAAWTEIAGPANSAAEISWWNERFETTEYDLEWATLPICLTIPRDPDLAYDIAATATDTFGQTVESQPGIIHLDDPTRRPPTTGEVVGLSSVAVVNAKSPQAGMVEFRSRPVSGPDDELDCASAPVVDGGVTTTTQRTIPVGVYDPDFDKASVARIPIPPGGQIVVCARIFPTTNTLRPLATDRLLLSSPTQERPRIVLQGIRRFGDVTIQPGLIVRAGSGPDPCSTGYSSRTPLEPDRTHTIEHVLWNCEDAPLPVDAAGTVEVPVTLTRTVPMGRGLPDERRQEEVAIPIRLQPCADPTGCDRPREWYEIPIPWNGSRLCGTSFGSGGCSEPAPTDGMAVIRVEYPVVAASSPTPSGRGAVTLIDQIDADAASGTPRVQIQEMSFLGADPDDILHRTARMEFFADRPVQVDVTAIEISSESCWTPTTVSTDSFASEFTIDLEGLCAGASYMIEFHAVDEDGNEYDFDGGFGYAVPGLSANMRAEVEFLGGDDVPSFGFIYRFDVLIDGQKPSAYWWDWFGSRGSAEGCIGLTGTRAVSRGSYPPITLSPEHLNVTVTATVTTTGERDCSGRAETGLGDIALHGRFTPEQFLADDPLVLESDPGVALPMRVTLTRSSPWQLRPAS